MSNRPQVQHPFKCESEYVEGRQWAFCRRETHSINEEGIALCGPCEDHIVRMLEVVWQPRRLVLKNPPPVEERHCYHCGRSQEVNE